MPVVAEKVEDQDEYDWAADAGAKLFQGYFFCKPTPLAGQELRAASIERLRAAAGLTQPDAGLEEIEPAVTVDPHLSLRLLQQLNSAAVSLPNRISSIRQGVILLGPRTVRQWALVLLLSGIGEQRGPLLATALARARTLELVAPMQGLRRPRRVVLGRPAVGLRRAGRRADGRGRPRAAAGRRRRSPRWCTARAPRARR